MALNQNQMTTGEVRLSYAHLYEPYSNNGGEPKYSVTVLMPKSDTAAKARLDAAFEAAKQKGIAEKWNGVLPPVLAVPVYDGDGVRPNGEPFGAECKGHWVFTASNKNPVQLVDAGMNPIMQKGELYSGCYARVCISMFAYNSNGKRGIGFGLEAVQKLRDGDPLGGGVSVADAFGGDMGAVPAQTAANFAGYPASANAVPVSGNYVPVSGNYVPVSANAVRAVDPITGLPM